MMRLLSRFVVFAALVGLVLMLGATPVHAIEASTVLGVTGAAVVSLSVPLRRAGTGRELDAGVTFIGHDCGLTVDCNGAFESDAPARAMLGSRQRAFVARLALGNGTGTGRGASLTAMTA